jgi:chromosome partitioning protein
VSRTIVVINQKGGTAKTTTAVNLAAAFAAASRTVLVVDLDEQCNATDHLDAAPGEHDVVSVLTKQADLDAAAVPSGTPGVEVVPASHELDGIERALGGKPGVELRLRTALAKARPRDIVLLDCPPSLGLLSANGLAAATEVLVPVAAGAMELGAVVRLQATLDEVAEALNPGLSIDHVLATRIDERRRLDQDVLASLGRAYPDQLLKTVIHENVRIKEAYSRRQPVLSYDPKGRAAEEYHAAALEILNRSST